MASTVANSAIDIASRALVLIGAEPITSFDSSSTEALVATNMYEDTVRSYAFYSEMAICYRTSCTNQLSDAPTGRFDIAHQLPSDLLVLHAVTVNDNF